MMLNILFITSASHTPSHKNLNHFQRAFFLSRHARLTILGGKYSDFRASTSGKATILRGAFPGKAGILFSGILLAMSGRARAFDIVLTEPSILLALGWVFKTVSRCKWVVDVWDIPIRFNMVDQSSFVQLRCRVIRRLFRGIFQWTDHFIVSILPDFELRDFHIPSSKMALFQNAIWQENGRAPRLPERSGGRPNILCMRSVHTRDMGLDTLVESFLILKQENDELMLTVVGDISSDTKRQLEGLGPKEGVLRPGFVPHYVLDEMIREATVCVIPFKDVPDLAQTYPIKVLEYMRAGKPIVASDIMGVRQMIVDGLTGLLFRPGDAGDLARKIRRVIEDAGLAKRLAQQAMESVRRNDCSSKNMQILEKLKAVAGLSQGYRPGQISGSSREAPVKRYA